VVIQWLLSIVIYTITIEVASQYYRASRNAILYCSETLVHAAGLKESVICHNENLVSYLFIVQPKVWFGKYTRRITGTKVDCSSNQTSILYYIT
jgi:hypothetical protein